MLLCWIASICLDLLFLNELRNRKTATTTVVRFVRAKCSRSMMKAFHNNWIIASWYITHSLHLFFSGIPLHPDNIDVGTLCALIAYWLHFTSCFALIFDYYCCCRPNTVFISIGPIVALQIPYRVVSFAHTLESVFLQPLSNPLNEWEDWWKSI